MSKGDWQRPVNKKKFNNNFDKIFKQNKKRKENDDKNTTRQLSR